MTLLLIVFVLAGINTFVLTLSLLRAWRRIAKLKAERDRLEFDISKMPKSPMPPTP